MKRLTKWMAAVLAACVAASLLPSVGVFAENDPAAEAITAEAVTVETGLSGSMGFSAAFAGEEAPEAELTGEEAFGGADALPGAEEESFNKVAPPLSLKTDEEKTGTENASGKKDAQETSENEDAGEAADSAEAQEASVKDKAGEAASADPETEIKDSKEVTEKTDGKEDTEESEGQEDAGEEKASEEDEEKPLEDGRIDLEIVNNTAMFKAVSAYLFTEDGKTELVMALSGAGYHELFKGTYDQAAANGNNRNRWIHGAVNDDGKWEFRIPLSDGETYIPVVAISQSYLDGFDAGDNSLERSFYPRQLVLASDHTLLITGDYENTQELEIINNVTMFKPEAAALETVGGPNSNGFKSNLILTMGSDAFNKAFIGTKEAAEAAENVYEIEGRVFTIPVRWVETFGRPETMQTLIGKTFVMSFHSVRMNTWYERLFTISEEEGTLTVDPADEDVPVDPAPVTPVIPDPDDDPEENSGYEANTGGSTAAVDNSTGLADGVYTPDKFSFSGGTGRIVISCSQVEVRGGKAYATIAFNNIQSGSTEMSYVKAGGGTWYCSQAGGTSIATIPVELNKNNSILAMTTKMSAAHEIAYTIFVYVAGAEAKSGAALTENKQMDAEAPVIAGLEAEGEETVEEAEYFKIFNYSDGIRLLEIDMRIDKEDKEEEEEEESSEETEEEEKEATVIDEETGLEVTITASKEEAQAKLYKGNVVKYLLVPEDVEIPAGLDKEAIIIQLPLKNVYSGSEKIKKTMEELGVSDLVTIQEKESQDKKIAGAGSYKDLKLRTLVKNKCDLVLLPNEILKDKKEREYFTKLGADLASLEIAAVADRSEMEKSDKAKAEWLKVYGILFGCEKEAQAAYEAVK